MQDQDGAVADTALRQCRCVWQSWRPQGRQLVARRRRRAGATVTQDVDDRRDQSRDGHRGGQGQVDGLGAGMYGDPAQSRSDVGILPFILGSPER